MGMVSRDHWQGVQLTGQLRCPGDGIVKLYSLGQCPLGPAAVMTVVDSPTWSKQKHLWVSHQRNLMHYQEQSVSSVVCSGARGFYMCMY